MLHSTTPWRGTLLHAVVVLAIVAVPSVPASAATVTIQPIVTGIGNTGDQAPGRITGFRFWGESTVKFPVINEAGEVVFRGFTAGLSRSDSPAFGIYSHRPGSPPVLSVLVDGTVDGAGTPIFAVPGRPADTRFLSFDAPVLSNSGDVLFEARFGSASGDSGSGLYAVKTSGGAITKVVDTFDAVPGVTGELFTGFASGLSGAFDGLTEAVLNDSGAVVFFGKFGFNTGDHGLYAGSVMGAAPVRLADSTQSVVPTGFGPGGGFRDIRSEFALSNAGIVAFRGFVGPSFSGGVFSVPVSGGTPRTVVDRFDPVPGTSPGFTSFTSFDGQDINESGAILFQASLAGNLNGLYQGTASAGPLGVIVDTLGGFAVPGNDPAAQFSGAFLGPLNESGQIGFVSRIITGGNPNSQGLYTADLSGGAVGLVIDTTQPAPGAVPAVNLTDFIGSAGNTPAINDAGNLAFSARADIAGGTVRGLYFFDACAAEVVRIVDGTTSQTLLGATFSTTGSQTRKLDLYQGRDAISGHYRGLNSSNDVAFLAQFSNFDFGIYVAHVTAGAGAGGVEITCPADAVVECGAATDPATTGSATAADSCTGAAVATTFSDVSAPGTGGTETITRTWSADDGSGAAVTCVQTIAVLDTTAPILTGVPADVSAECDVVPAVASPTVSDTCDADPTLTFAEALAIGTCLDEFTLTRSWTATDGSNNETIGSQVVFVADTTPPVVTCPADLSVSGGFGGTNVTFATSADDNCDPSAGVATNVASGSFFNTGVTAVTATAMDRCSNSASCSFDVLVSCFGVNRAKIGTRDFACRGIEEIEFTSMSGTEELILLFKAEEGSGGVEEDTLPPSIVVDDGVNGAITVDTTCAQALEIGDVLGPYTVTDIEKDFDDFPDDHGNEVELRGSFVPAVPFDLAVDDLVLSLDDGQGHTATFTIPAGSFQADGNPEKGKFKFEGNIGVADVKAKLQDCSFKFKAKNAANTGLLTGSAMTVTLAVGVNRGVETIVLENKGNHLKFKREPKVNCCPTCKGVASMQVTSDQGVRVFYPPSGQTKLASNTVVDDGVNSPVTIHTSCSQTIDVGGVFGAYTISELIKVFDEGE